MYAGVVMFFKLLYLQIVSAIFPIRYSVPYLCLRAVIAFKPMAYQKYKNRIIQFEFVNIIYYANNMIKFNSIYTDRYDNNDKVEIKFRNLL